MAPILNLRIKTNFCPLFYMCVKLDLVTQEWRRLPNEELHDLYSSPSTIRVM
jgi:hypothetical protein